MGQSITVAGRTVAGDVAAFHTDRAVTGQDGSAYGNAEAARQGEGFAAELSARIFEADDAIDHVFVASNQIVVRRNEGWDDSALEAVSDIVIRFFVFYVDG